MLYFLVLGLLLSGTQVTCSSGNSRRGYRDVGMPGKDHVVLEGNIWRCGFLDHDKVQCNFNGAHIAAVMWHYNQKHEQVASSADVAGKPASNLNRKRKSSGS